MASIEHVAAAAASKPAATGLEHASNAFSLVIVVFPSIEWR
jgi:hypothetical protein